MSLTETIEKPISMVEVKEKLRNLENYMPKQKKLVYDFGKFLADRLNPELVPEGFFMAAQSAISDLEKGVDEQGNSITNTLCGYAPSVYATLAIQILQIAEATCPTEFAQSVRIFYNEILEERKEID